MSSRFKDKAWDVLSSLLIVAVYTLFIGLLILISHTFLLPMIRRILP